MVLLRKVCCNPYDSAYDPGISLRKSLYAIVQVPLDAEAILQQHVCRLCILIGVR